MLLTSPPPPPPFSLIADTWFSNIIWQRRLQISIIWFVSSLLQNWMAYTNLSVGNFTLTDSLLFTNYNLLSQQANYAFCQVWKQIVWLLNGALKFICIKKIEGRMMFLFSRTNKQLILVVLSILHCALIHGVMVCETCRNLPVKVICSFYLLFACFAIQVVCNKHIYIDILFVNRISTLQINSMLLLLW